MSADILNLDHFRKANEEDAVRFMFAVSVVAERKLSKEVPGVTCDPALDVLILAARMYRDVVLQRKGGKP